MKKLVTIGRGGTGKTSFVALMTKYLIEKGVEPILLVDADRHRRRLSGYLEKGVGHLPVTAVSLWGSDDIHTVTQLVESIEVHGAPPWYRFYITSFSLAAIARRSSASSSGGSPLISTLRKPLTMVAVASSWFSPRAMR